MGSSSDTGGMFSQHDEDDIIRRVFDLIGDGNKIAVEFGAADGIWLSNTAALEKLHGWKRYLFEGGESSNPLVIRAMLTVENINEVFDAAGVPAVVDFLSIDVDGNDFWLWKALKTQSRVTMIEYNEAIRCPLSKVMPYNPEHRWDRTSYFGASLTALVLLATATKNQVLVYADHGNALFVDAAEARRTRMEEIAPFWEQRFCHRPETLNRPWLTVREGSPWLQ